MRLRAVNHQAFIAIAISMSLVAINYQQRENCYQLKALHEHIGNADTLNLILLPDGLVGTLEKTGDTNVGGPV